MMGKELREQSFWKSAEEIEKEEFNFAPFLEKSEKSASGWAQFPIRVRPYVCDG